MHITTVNKMFERAVNERSLSPRDVLTALHKTALKLTKNKGDLDSTQIVTNLDTEHLDKAWSALKKTKLVRKSKSSKAVAKLMQDVFTGLVIDNGLSLHQVADRAIVLLNETGGKKHRKRVMKANLTIVAFAEALVKEKPAQ
jgi:hypothetical protein